VKKYFVTSGGQNSPRLKHAIFADSMRAGFFSEIAFKTFSKKLAIFEKNLLAIFTHIHTIAPAGQFS
jgi:hypothetical protein